MVIRSKTSTILRLDDNGSARFYFNNNGTSSPSGMSDRRNKRNIDYWTGSATDEIKKLDGKFATFNFIYNDDDHVQQLDEEGNWGGNMDWNLHHGVIAQDIQAMDGEITKLVHRLHPDEDVVAGDDTDTYFYFDYEGLSAMNSKAIIELEARIRALEEAAPG